MRVTRSPSRTPLSRNAATAAFALWAFSGERWWSSKTMTNERLVRLSATRLVETGGRGVTGRPGAGAGRSTASKLEISCFTPSSSRVKSSRWRPATGRPSFCVTTASTVTSSTVPANVGGGLVSVFGGGWARVEAAPPMTPTSSVAGSRYGRCSMTTAIARYRFPRPISSAR